MQRAAIDPGRPIAKHVHALVNVCILVCVCVHVYLCARMCAYATRRSSISLVMDRVVCSPMLCGAVSSIAYHDSHCGSAFLSFVSGRCQTQRLESVPGGGLSMCI